MRLAALRIVALCRHFLMLVCAQVWEVVDNAIDEVQAGCATRVDVELLPDGAVSITDDGRGVSMPPKAVCSILLKIVWA